MPFDWKKIVRTIAPTIGTALGGPMAGIAVQAVSNAVLGKPDGTEDEISAVLLGANQETLLALKKADNDFKLRMKELEIDFEKLAYDDADSARKREMEIKDNMPAILAVLLVSMFGVALYSLFTIAIPEGNKATIYTMIGSLGTLTITACAYYHGSSRGSAQKNELIFNQKK